MARLLLTCVALCTLVSCGSPELRRFPVEAPVWVDRDDAPLAEAPREYWSGLMWDGADKTAFWPLARFFAVDPAGEAANVNAFDEVPDSSWFENRIGFGGMSLDELARGACPEDRLDPASTWTIVSAKPDGANPGFIIRDEQGRGWVIKFDGRTVSDERATTADVLGSRIYHAAGYHSPCNIIVWFDDDIIEISPDAEAENELGMERPMTRDDVDSILEAAVRDEDGRFRASASLFLPGRPLGPWTYEGIRRDDPNDVIRHEDRRELRGAAVLAAWLNHFDAREQNTLSVWIDHSDDTGHVRHYYLDFGDCLGARWASDEMTRRFGYGYYFHPRDIVVDLATLGLVRRPWHDVEVNEVAPLWGYFDVEHFEPQRWLAGYRNPAFSRMQPEDGAWMARIIAMIDEPALRAMLDEARMSNPVEREELVAILLGRRQRILEYYLRVRSPLALPEVRGDDICFTDLAGVTGVWDPRTVRYEARMLDADETQQWSRLIGRPEPVDPAWICVPMTSPDGERPADGLSAAVTDDDPRRYRVLDVYTTEVAGADPVPPLRLHVVDTAADGFRLVGIERPDAGDDR